MAGCQRNEQAVKVERALLSPTQVVEQRLWCKTSRVHIYPFLIFLSPIAAVAECLELKYFIENLVNNKHQKC